MADRLSAQVAFLAEVDKMKTVFRQTILIDRSRRETDAEHSWHFALAAMLLYEYADTDRVDLNRVIKMALVHDLVEIYAGDTFAFDEEGHRDKAERELRAAEKLFTQLPPDQGGEIRALWDEFEAMETPDAQYAAAIDRLQPFINNSYTDGHTWRQGGVSAGQVYRRMDMVRQATPELWPWVEEVVRLAVERGQLRAED